MSELTERLDKVANTLESQGLLKEAMDLDMVTNTIEAMEKEAWYATKSPQYALLMQTLDALNSNNVQKATMILNKGQQSTVMFQKSYGHLPAEDGSYPARGYADSYTKALRMAEQGQADNAMFQVQSAMGYLEKLEPIVTRQQSGGASPTPGPTDMAFTTKTPAAPGTVRQPIQPPVRAVREEA